MKEMDLLIGTSNKGKFIEMREALRDLPLKFIAPEDMGILESPSEYGSTHDENARIKAQFFHERSRIPTIADDSGIMIDALQDELGLHTRRWGAGSHATDGEWIAHFLKRMEHETNRRATFICSIAYVDASGIIHGFQGECSGIITPTIEAPYLPGLPISACFKPDGFDKVFSALTTSEKNQTSHRGRALLQLKTFLQTST